MASSKIIPTEHQEQVLLVNWLRLQHPSIRFFAIPNGIRSSIKQAIKVKKEGVSSGVPDLYFPKWKLWIEMKRQKNSTTSPEQKGWHHYLVEECGDTVYVCKGFVHAKECISSFLSDLTTSIKD